MLKAPPNTTMIPKQTTFGSLPSGEPVHAWRLVGAGGLELEIIAYGGIVTKILVPDANGQRTNVALGYDTLAPLLARHPYFGAITGRVAGRVTNAVYRINGHDYRVAANEGQNHIHGGLVGLDRRIWAATPGENADGSPWLKLTYRSPDGEEGYPGNVDFTVIYTVTADNAFVFETEAIADQLTPINLTNHSYFNLSGAGDIKDHRITLFADSFFPVNDDYTLANREVPTSGAPEDLNTETRIGDVLPQLFGEHGSLYRIRRAATDTIVPAARVVDPASGRTLAVSTTETHLQFYAGSMLADGSPFARHSALCLECHGYPNGVAHPEFGDIMARPGKPVRHRTVYAFA